MPAHGMRCVEDLEGHTGCEEANGRHPLSHRTGMLRVLPHEAIWYIATHYPLEPDHELIRYNFLTQVPKGHGRPIEWGSSV
jgi:hypothetical protein